MNRRSMKVFLGASGALLLGLAALPAKGGDEPSAEVRAAAVPGAAPIAAPPEMAAAVAVAPDLLRDQWLRSAALRWGRDPFAGPIQVRPPSLPAPVTLKLPDLPHLSGLSMSKSGPRAILDRDIAGPGEALSSGWTVQVIEAGFVTLRYESEIRILQLRDDP